MAAQTLPPVFCESLGFFLKKFKFFNIRMWLDFSLATFQILGRPESRYNLVTDELVEFEK